MDASEWLPVPECGDTGLHCAAIHHRAEAQLGFFARTLGIKHLVAACEI